MLLYLCYDISRRTTFPGSHPALKQPIKQDIPAEDSVKVDSLKSIHRQKSAIRQSYDHEIGNAFAG